MNRIRTRAAIAIVVTALTLTPVLTSCGQAAEQAAEAAAEEALGGDVELTDEGVTMTDEEGNEVAIGENVSLPDNWPAEVPVFDGGTLQMVSVKADGAANAMWMTDVTPDEAAAAYGAALEAAGYTAESNSNMGGMIVGQYTGNGYKVGFNSLDSDGTTTVMVDATKG